MADDNGWVASANAWIDDLESAQEFGRRHVLDPVMSGRIANRGFSRALDIGCGEGRFCRMMSACKVAATGVDPTAPLIAEARRRDPDGDYRIGSGERLEFGDASFDLVVSYLSLIDIPDIAAAIPEMARVLSPGGTLLVANLTSFNTAATIARDDRGWRRAGGAVHGYLDDRSGWSEWRGIRVRNHHRSLSRYMSLLLATGLQLRYFDEPAASGGPAARRAKFNDAPWFHVMEWQKPV